jgi:serine phosphatase RsbU (regulator of sigma subunit)/predicted negative regulator of RcsB-dependent stress response
MRKYLYSFFLLLLPSVLFAQISTIDSLMRKVRTAPDSLKVNIWNDLSREYLADSPANSELYADSALKQSILLRDEKGKARSLINKGAALAAQNKYSEAHKNYIEALKIRERIGDTKGIANAHRNIGDLFAAQKNYQKANEHLIAASKIYEETSNTQGLMSTMNSLGSIHYAQNDFYRALNYFQEALKIGEELRDSTTISALINNIGSVFLELKEYDKALESFERSLHITESIGDKEGVAVGYNNLGYVYEKKGDHQKAIEHQEKSLALAKELNVKTLINNAYTGLAEAYVKINDYHSAYKYRTLSSDIKDTIFDIESNRNITEMQTRFDTEKKEKENEILKQRVEIQSLDNKRQQLVLYSITGGLVLVGALGFFAFRSYRIKRRANISLAKQNKEIEDKNTELHRAYSEIEQKSTLLEEKNKDITDSIKYAKRIQQAILPTTFFATEFRDKGFILYKPKDIVSGDFYWMEKRLGKLFVAAVDCTGHGVPGAFMSIVGYNLLNQIVNESGITKPADILTELSRGVTDTLKQKVEETSVRDGMDLAICSIDYKNMVLEYAGAYNPLWLIREGHLIEVKGDKFPIGTFMDETIHNFTNHRIDLQPGDIIYMFSDGYADQFGGPTGKKFKYKNFKELVLSIHKNKLHDQCNILDHTIEAWRGDLEQVDDIMVVGIRI